jgi:hypothetical protein
MQTLYRPDLDEARCANPACHTSGVFAAGLRVFA